MSIKTPYNFAPLSRFIYLPNWAGQVSHDLPFSDGVSGTLNMELECHTDTLVGGEQQPATEQQAGLVEFYKDPDGSPVIPGSSLKGMLSNVLEIASFARFNRLDDKRYSVRDLSSANNFYFQQFPGNPKGGQAGWLTYNANKGQWQITPCKMARIHQREIISHLKLDKNAWKKAGTASQRYKLLKGIQDIGFNIDQHKTKGTIAQPDAKGEQQGKLVVTGQPGPAFDVNKRSKKWEFVFYAPQDSSEAVPQRVMKDFMFIHSESDEWAHWQRQRAAYGEPGIPVFYLKDGSNIGSIGLAYLYRLAYKNTTHDAVNNTQVSHLNSDSPDLPALIFGHISEDKNKPSLRGRVNIGAAEISGAAEYQNLPATVLGGPKPSYYPAYVRQKRSGQLDNPKDYRTLMNDAAELSGWKRYPTRDRVRVTKLDGEQQKNTKIQVKLKPVKAGSTFRFKIHFHNLREVELGALLWSLDFGGADNCYHNIGMGKPFGMGRVSLKLNAYHLETNQVQQLQGTELLDKARFSFIQLMNDAYASACEDQATPEERPWHNSPQIKALLAMATPQDSADSPYMALNDHADSKKSGKAYTLEPAANTDVTPPLAVGRDDKLGPDNAINPLSDADFAEMKAKQQAEQAAREQKRQAEQARQAQMAEASAEQQQVLALERLVEDYLDKPTGTARKKLNNQLRKCAKAAVIEQLDATWLDKCQAAIAPLEPGSVNELAKLQKALDKATGKG